MTISVARPAGWPSCWSPGRALPGRGVRGPALRRQLQRAAGLPLRRRLQRARLLGRRLRSRIGRLRLRRRLALLLPARLGGGGYGYGGGFGLFGSLACWWRSDRRCVVMRAVAARRAGRPAGASRRRAVRRLRRRRGRGDAGAGLPLQAPARARAVGARHPGPAGGVRRAGRHRDARPGWRRCSSRRPSSSCARRIPSATSATDGARADEPDQRRDGDERHGAGRALAVPGRARARRRRARRRARTRPPRKGKKRSSWWSSRWWPRRATPLADASAPSLAPTSCAALLSELGGVSPERPAGPGSGLDTGRSE